MKKIILIYPGVKEQMLMLPLGILSVGAYLIKFGYKVDFIDMRLDHFDDIDFNNYIAAGISAMTGAQIGYGLKISKLAKAINPKIKIIWGGTHPTILPEETVENKHVDVVVKGEGEVIFKNLIDCITKNGNLKSVKGICYKDENGKIINNQDEDAFPLDIVPPLPYNQLKNINLYNCNEVFPIELSRGCPGKCTFCFNNQKKGAKIWRSFNSKQILKKMELIINEFNPKVFFFVDDQSLVKKDLIRKIASGFIDNKWKFKWYTSTTFNCFSSYDEKTIELLVKSGLYALKFGGESGSPKILKSIKKAHTIENCYKSIELCKKYNIQAVINFMIGFENETKKDIKKTFKLIDDLMNIYDKCSVKTIWRLTPYPGTEVFNRAVELGYKYPKSLEEWDGYGFNTTKKLPWLKGSEFKKYEIINNVTRYLQNIKFKLHKPRNITDFLEQFFTIDARLRWKFKFFNFALEWKLRNIWIQKKQGKGSI